MSKYLQIVFGVRVTVLYSNGAKMRFRAREFNIKNRGADVTSITWACPWFSWSRQPVFPNVEKIDAVWGGRA